MKNKSGKIIYISISLAILSLLAYFFYWRNIRGSGFYASDEGYYVQIIKTYFYAIKYFKNLIFGHENLGSLKDYLAVYGGPFYNNAREGYIFLLSGVSSLFLKDYNFYHGLEWSALFGIANIYLVYIFVLSNFGRGYALIAAVLFAISPLSVAFARSGMTITTAMFFLLSGILLYFKSFLKPKFIRYAAFCFGLAFSCHYNLLWIFPVVLLVELYYFINKNKKIKRIINFLIFLSLPLILIESLTILIMFFLKGQPYFIQRKTAGYVDYFSGLLLMFKGISDNSFTEVIENNPFYYMVLLIKQHSIYFVFLCLLGWTSIVKMFIKTKDEKWLFLSAFFIPFILYSLIYHKADRMILPFIPIICIYVAIIPFFLNNKAKFLIAIPLILIFMHETRMSVKALKYQMDISEAISYMKNGQGLKHISSRMYISQAYIGKQNVIDDFYTLGRTPGESGKSEISLASLRDAYEDGFRYYLNYYGDEHRLAKIARQINPEKTYYKYHNTEGHYGRLPNALSDVQVEAIKIYDLKKIIDHYKELNLSG